MTGKPKSTEFEQVVDRHFHLLIPASHRKLLDVVKGETVIVKITMKHT